MFAECSYVTLREALVPINSELEGQNSHALYQRLKHSCLTVKKEEICSRSDNIIMHSKTQYAIVITDMCLKYGHARDAVC